MVVLQVGFGSVNLHELHPQMDDELKHGYSDTCCIGLIVEIISI